MRAPFAGRWDHYLESGAYLNTGDKVVSSRRSIPILVDFGFPQLQLARAFQGQTLHVGTDAFREEPSKVRSPRSTRSSIGHPQLQVEAFGSTIPPGGLLPGIFAQVAVKSGDKKRYLTLAADGHHLQSVRRDCFLEKQVRGRQVVWSRSRCLSLSAVQGDQAAILSGIKEVTRWWTSGQLKLKNGDSLLVDNSVVPKDDPNPTPQEQ